MRSKRSHGYDGFDRFEAIFVEYASGVDRRRKILAIDPALAMSTNRPMPFFKLVLKNLFRRRFRSALTVIGMAVAVGAVVGLLGIAQGFERSFLDLYQQRGVDLIVVRAGSSQRLTSSLEEKLEPQIASLPGVKHVAGGLMDVVSFEELDMFGVIIQGWPAGCFMFNDLRLISGRELRAGDKKCVMLGAMLAKGLNKKVGDLLEIVEGESFEVIGIYESFSVYENSLMVVLLEELQRLMDRHGQVTGFYIVAKDAKDKAALHELGRGIESLQTGLAAMPTQDFVTSSQYIRTAEAMAWLISCIAMVIGATGMLNTMVTSVFERTREIGILRAIGWRKRRVVRMVLLESIMLSLAGAVLGSVGAALLIRGLSRSPMAGGLVSGEIAPIVFAEGLVIALVVGLVGGLYPALRGANLPPTEAIRHE